MKRITLVKIHIIASAVAVLTITSFFVSSVVAELTGDAEVIRKVKATIVVSLPVLIAAMPTLAITGNRLAGQSQNPGVLRKQNRMKFIVAHGIALIALACTLYYRSHYQNIDSIFLGLQLAEFGLGLTNLTLMGLNIKDGLRLSGRLKK